MMSDTLNDVFSSTVKWLNQSGQPHQALMLCESTSKLAKEGAFHSPPIFVYLAAQQTHGRGRGDHTWSSPPEGAGLMGTWAFHLNKAPQHLTAPLVGLNVYRALTQTWPHLPWSLKAPNDLFLDTGKAGGLLVETISRGDSHNLLIGFGLNLLNTPTHVPIATCLNNHLETKVTETQWHQFLSHAHKGFQQAIDDCHRHQLSPELQNELLVALQRHPHYKDLQSVSPDGDLTFPDRTVDWFSI